MTQDELLTTIDQSVTRLATTLGRFVGMGLVSRGHLTQLPVSKLVELETRFGNVDTIDPRKFMSAAGTAPRHKQLFPDRQLFLDYLHQIQETIYTHCRYKPTFVVYGSFADPYSTPCAGDLPSDVSDLDMHVLYYWYDMRRQLEIEQSIRELLKSMTFEFKPNFGFMDKRMYELITEIKILFMRRMNVAPPYMSMFHPTLENSV